MKKNIYISILAALCSLLLAVGSFAAEQKMGEKEQQREQEKQGYSQQQEQQRQQQAGQQEQQKSQYAQQLVTPDKLHGLKIRNQQGEEIGSVDKVVLDSQSGQIAYVVVTSGGFWGIGGEKAVIPWNAVQLQQAQQQVGQEGQQQRQQEPSLVVNVSKEQLKNAPQGEIQETLDRQQAEQIHQYYGVSPYWEGQQEQQQREQQMQQQEGQHEQKQQEKEQQRMQ